MNMINYLAMVGVEDEGGVPIGIYSSVEDAIVAICKYVLSDGVRPYVEIGDFYEVYKYEVDSDPIAIQDQVPVAFGDQLQIISDSLEYNE